MFKAEVEIRHHVCVFVCDTTLLYVLKININRAV